MLNNKTYFPLLTVIFMLILCVNFAGATSTIEVYSGAIEEGGGCQLIDSPGTSGIMGAEALSIDSYSPAWNEAEMGGGQIEPVEFSITTNQACTVNWYVNGALEKTEASSGNSSFFMNMAACSPGMYELRAVASKNSETVVRAWTLRLLPENYRTGSRVWDEGAGLSDNEYIWNALSYSGFFYDPDTGDFSEELVIENIGRNIGEGDVTYMAAPLRADFEYNNWGSYQIIGFLGEKYFAGYVEDDTPKIVSGDISLISDGVLSRVLIDSDENKSIRPGSALALEEGYALKILELDVYGEKAWVQLEKDGDIVDDAFLSSGDDYVYETDLGDAEDIPIIIVHFNNISNEPERVVSVDGIYQVSDNYIELNAGNSCRKMEVTSVSSSCIIMKNDEDISLPAGETVTLMGKIGFRVADDSTLRFAPVLDMSEAGKYELRGTVYDAGMLKTLEWTPLNFEGFYYNIDEGIGTESLEILEDKLDGREIDYSGLVYSTVPAEVEFEHEDWGEFQIIGFMGEEYFAGFEEANTAFADDDINLLSGSLIGKVLANSDDMISIYSNSSLLLDEGYCLSIKEIDISGGTFRVQLLKDGVALEEASLSSGDTYIYENDLGNVEDIPQIAVHFGTVFAGVETSAVFVEGIFHISDDYIELEDGDIFGEMEIKYVGKDGIVMKNEDDISLGEGETVDIMGDVRLRVADDATLRFYPFVEYVKENSGGTSGIKWDISPENPEIGDTIILRGTASPDELLRLEVSLEKEVPVSDGKYEYQIDEVEIPRGDNLFSVKAEGVNDLYVRANKIIWLPTLKSEASGGVATISQGHVPASTYKIRIEGQAENGTENVTLKFTAAQTIEADSSGKFAYVYKTSSMPAGEYQVKLGGISKTVTLKAGAGSSSWNPWIFPASKEGEKISTGELQEAIYCWLNSEAAPETGAEITTGRLQEIICRWQEAEEA